MAANCERIDNPRSRRIEPLNSVVSESRLLRYVPENRRTNSAGGSDPLSTSSHQGITQDSVSQSETLRTPMTFIRAWNSCRQLAARAVQIFWESLQSTSKSAHLVRLIGFFDYQSLVYRTDGPIGRSSGAIQGSGFLANTQNYCSMRAVTQTRQIVQ
jgi:hypothetical protein